jgi:hypothetical protein
MQTGLELRASRSKEKWVSYVTPGGLEPHFHFGERAQKRNAAWALIGHFFEYFREWAYTISYR